MHLLDMSGLRELKSASIYRRKANGKPSGRWKLEVRYEGTRPRISTWDTRQQAHQELARLKDLACRVIAGGPERPFIEYAEEWMERQGRLGLAASTVDRKRSTIRTWLAPSHARWGFTNHRIGSITAGLALELFAEMRRQQRSERTVHKTYEVLNQLLTAAVRDLVIPHNPLDRLLRGERPRPTRQRTPRIMTHNQVWEVFHEIRRRRGEAFPDYSLLWLTAYYQGLRAGEGIALTAEDFDFDRAFFSRDNFKQRRHTGPRGLIAPVSTLLRGYIQSNRIAGLLWPAMGVQRVKPGLAAKVEALRAAGLTFTEIGRRLGISDVWASQVHRRLGEPPPLIGEKAITPSFLRQQVWGPAMQSLNLKFVMKDLRNSCVVNLIDGVMTGETVEPKDVMHHVDHRSLRMTLDTYYQFRPQGRIGRAEPRGTTVEEALSKFDPTVQDGERLTPSPPTGPHARPAGP